MEIKFDIQGLLIYTAMSAYILALSAGMRGRAKVGQRLFALGFVVTVCAFSYRCYQVRHVPLQNLFEVFLFLGMICYPLSWFSRRFLRISGQAADMLIGTILLFPAGFVFSDKLQPLPPLLRSWLFGPHVAVYMLAYIFMAKAAFQAVVQFSGKKADAQAGFLQPEEATYRMICAGFPLLTLGLVLGSWWGKLAWGDWWGWDPKELWSLVSWLVYVGYFHFRYMFGKKYPRMNSIWAIVGMITIVITLLWVNLSRLFPGLHSYAT
jgi:ABC-type transport system involved in cytochrome c biogenesis permease subunit